MRVQRLVMPGSGVQSWTLLGEDLAPVVPAERFLAYLASIDRSPNTVRAYAHDLKDWFVFLAGRGVDWRSATVEDVGAFAGWLRLPPAGRDGLVAVLPSAPQRCGGSTVNRKLAALTSFCEFHARHGEPLAGLLVTTAPPGWPRGSSCPGPPVTLRCRSASSISPDLVASDIAGTSPACDTRFGSSNTIDRTGNT